MTSRNSTDVCIQSQVCLICMMGAGSVYSVTISNRVWRRCVIEPNGHQHASELLEMLLRNLAEQIRMEEPTPEIGFSLFEDAEELKLKAHFSPDWKGGVCITLMMQDEQPVKEPRFSLGRVVVSDAAKQAIHADVLKAALGRHIYGDWTLRVPENEHAFECRSTVDSFHIQLSSSNVYFWVTTDLAESLTKVLLHSENDCPNRNAAVACLSGQRV